LKNVRQRRSDLGIAAWAGERRAPLWNETEIEMLGTRPDHEAAKLLGRSVTSVKVRRQRLGIVQRFVKPDALTPEEIELLGAIPDDELAVKLGRTRKAIEYWRTKLKKPY